jgi:large subunit ribosomal protein L25
MEIATVQGETRKLGGRHLNERLRRRGFVPAVIYGHNEPPETVALSLHDTELALERMAHVIKLQVAGQEVQYLVKDVQYDHLQKTPVHVDLMRVDVNERVQVKVPIELRGTPKGAAEGGSLVQVLTELDVECLLLEIPDALKVKVDHLELNQMLQVRDIAVPADIKVLHGPDDIVAIVQPPRGTTTEELVVAEGAATTSEPEVITKGKEDEDEDAKK